MSDPARLRACMTSGAGGKRRRIGHPEQHHRAVAPQQVEIGVVVVLRGHRVEDQVEAAGVPLEQSVVAGRDEVVRTERSASARLLGEWLSTVTRAPIASRQLHRHVAEPAQTDHRDLVARP